MTTGEKNAKPYTYVEKINDRYTIVGYECEPIDPVIGVADHTGKIIIPLDWDKIWWNERLKMFNTYRENYTDQQSGFLDGIWGLFDENGQRRLYLGYDTLVIYDVCDCICVGRKGKYGVIDVNGKILVPIIYDDIEIAFQVAKCHITE